MSYKFKPLTVENLSKQLKKIVESHFCRVYVIGEVSGFKRHISGHIYFSLKDSFCIIDAICWKGNVLHFSIIPKEGMEIIVVGYISTYMGRSKYQIIIEKIEPVGEGSLLKLLNNRRKKLALEGLFDELKKKDVSKFPSIIGVITSPTGSVIIDILHRVRERYPCRVIIWPVSVQNFSSADSISKAIYGFNDYNLPFPNPDVIIVARGGGSLEDLWAFNEEIVVRSIFKSLLPIVSAIGHETDITLVDFASDKRVPTPTAAVEHTTPVLKDIQKLLNEYFYRNHNVMKRFLFYYFAKIESILKLLPNPEQLLNNYYYNLNSWKERMERILLQIIKNQKNKIENLIKIINGYSYHKVIERGFLIAKTSTGILLTNSKSIPDNQKAILVFSDGEVTSLLKPKKFDLV